MPSTIHQLLNNFIQIENLSVCQAPLLKQYYWEYFDIEKFNLKLRLPEIRVTHIIRFPPQILCSLPYKIVLWIRNESAIQYRLNVRRVQKCQCHLVETRVGFNQFRHMFHCPHRNLVHILQDNIVMESNELVAMKLIVNFCVLGEHTLCFEMKTSDDRTISLYIRLDIVNFSPNKCVLTKNLVPIDIKEYRRCIQAIWIRNITMQNLQFSFSTDEHGFKILNPNLSVPRQSVWPLMVEYRPTDMENLISLSMAYNGRPYKVYINASAYVNEEPEFTEAPDRDYDCVDLPFIIYPNKLDFDMNMEEQRTKLVAIHNYSQECVEMSWQKYEINSTFKITFDPPIFRLKPHRSKLCRIIVLSSKRSLNFTRIPTILVINKIQDKATKLAKSLLQEVTLIDDPKCVENVYIQHVYLHINLKINFKEEDVVDFELVDPVPEEPIRENQIPRPQTTIFEKLFWQYLADSNFRRPNNNIRTDYTYEEVINPLKPAPEPPISPNKDELLSYISRAICYSLKKTAANWRFVPMEYCTNE
ncbi:uncharacterized protein LOC119671073 [Teleopsis dalmanni]|uniref:uncharacterized protein LOC119671071 n=1 Tax=Teleopsis dalmanni TaxID=139649 RepID=UPI0018CD58EF|nr:uncharacterized protein LOC119671071 [Teleopsis dalmanni]XP_037937503.1 uncharacterized protein LOC119671073 [Teleopsis dalmanni]